MLSLFLRVGQTPALSFLAAWNGETLCATMILFGWCCCSCRCRRRCRCCCRCHYSPPARWGLLDFMSVACSSPPLLSSSSCSTATLDAQCSLSDLNHDHPRPVFPAGPQPRPSPPIVPCRTSTTTIHAQCSLPDLNREYPRQVFPAGPHVGRYGTKNVQKKVRKKVCQIECQNICQI